MISHGHALFLATCRWIVGLGLLGLMAAVVLDGGLLWLVAGAPVLVVGFGAVAYLGTDLISKRQGVSTQGS